MKHLIKIYKACYLSGSEETYKNFGVSSAQESSGGPTVDLVYHLKNQLLQGSHYSKTKYENRFMALCGLLCVETAVFKDTFYAAEAFQSETDLVADYVTRLAEKAKKYNVPLNNSAILAVYKASRNLKDSQEGRTTVGDYYSGDSAALNLGIPMVDAEFRALFQAVYKTDLVSRRYLGKSFGLQSEQPLACYHEDIPIVYTCPSDLTEAAALLTMSKLLETTTRGGRGFNNIFVLDDKLLYCDLGACVPDPDCEGEELAKFVLRQLFSLSGDSEIEIVREPFRDAGVGSKLTSLPILTA